MIRRVVLVPSDSTDTALLTFPVAGVADQLDYVFDFSLWLAPLDRVTAAAVACATLPHGEALIDGARIVARIGPADAPGSYAIACTVVTSQSRIKSVVATVSLQ